MGWNGSNAATRSAPAFGRAGNPALPAGSRGTGGATRTSTPASRRPSGPKFLSSLISLRVVRVRIRACASGRVKLGRAGPDEHQRETRATADVRTGSRGDELRCGGSTGLAPIGPPLHQPRRLEAEADPPAERPH